MCVRRSRDGLKSTGVPVNLSVPDHRELDRVLLRGLIRDAGLTIDEFVALLD
jgi:hypothetical protein